MTPPPSPDEAIGEALQGYLRKHLQAPALEVSAINAIPEGHSGFTYFLDLVDAGVRTRTVLRLPPPGARIAGPADIPRQGRVMAALNALGLPTPRVIANCEDPSVLPDGRPFVLMEAVDGERIEAVLDRAPAIEIARAAVDTLHRLQQVPPAATGLGGEPVVSLTEEMLRWNWLMSRAPQELTTRAPRLGELLASGRPAEPGPTLVHADYHYGNLLFRVDGGEVRVVGVLDWEIAELGAPLLDLGCLCVVAQRNQVPGTPNPGGGLDIDVEEVIALYGGDPAECRWYLALSCYKYASIFGYNLMLHRRGKRPDPMYENLTGVITALIDQGAEMLG